MKSLTPLILIGIAIASYYMYIGPTYTNVMSLRDKKSSHEEVLMKAKNIIAKRDQIVSDYNSIPQTSLEKLRNIIPEKFDSVLVTNHISNIANKYGLIIDNIKLLDVPADNSSPEMQTVPTYKTHTISFTTSGKYENFVLFLRDLETNTKVIDITDLNVLADRKDEKSNNLEYDFKFQTYSLK